LTADADSTVESNPTAPSLPNTGVDAGAIGGIFAGSLAIAVAGVALVAIRRRANA
jgi:LPXTG-motif cell wall-anchored protein